MEAADCVYIKDPESIGNKEELIKHILFAVLWDRKQYVEFLLRNYSKKVLTKEEIKQITKLLRIKTKRKIVINTDGISSKKYSDGRGYLTKNF
jgi:arsenate reductase-like glutaredoxin family protein